MTEITLREALLELISREVASADSAHRRATADCPTLPRFLRAVVKGWSTTERGHVSDCDYCQTTLFHLWSEQPPTVFQVALYTADPANYPDRQAMTLYLKHKGARFEGLFQNLLRVKRLLGASQETIATALDEASAFFSELPLPSPALAAAAEVEGSLGKAAMQFTDVCLNLTYGLRSDSNGYLKAFAVTNDSSRKGMRYRVTVLSSTSQIDGELELSEKSGHLAGEVTIGVEVALLHRLGRDCLVLIQPAERSPKHVAG